MPELSESKTNSMRDSSRRKKQSVNSDLWPLGNDQYLISITDHEGCRTHFKGVPWKSADRTSTDRIVYEQIIQRMRRFIVEASAARSALRDYPESADDFNHEPDAEKIITQLENSTGILQASLVCDAEALQLDQMQRDRLSSILWRYIVDNRDSQNTKILVAVGSAIRKYVAMLNLDRMGEISELLEAGHRAQLTLNDLARLRATVTAEIAMRY
jgi:hypothetical protein